MSGVRTAAASAASVPGIPAGARKMVQSLKEIVGHGEEEIYAMLKECNMDPNETAQRLMSQDTFHEVKRKRDKKKEVSSNNKDAFEVRSRPAGAFRGGRGDRGAGRGGSLSRNTSNEFGNGRGKPWLVRENGSHFSGASTTPPAADSNPPKPAPSLSGSSGLTGSSPGLPNGYTPNASTTQGTWVKVASHGTMADMLKSNGSHAPSNVVTTGAPSNTLQTFPSGMYSSSDPVHHPSPDHRAAGGVNAIKREIGIVGNQRPIGDRLSAFGGSLPSPSHPSHVHASTSEEDEVRAASPPTQQEIPKSQDSLSDRSNASEAHHQSSGLPVSRSLAVGNGRLAYQQQQSLNVQKSTGANLEWKPKLVPQDVSVPGLNTVESVVTEALKSPPASAIAESDVASVTTNFEDLATRDEQQVIMPNNIQSQGDLGLSFGSFGESFGSSLPSGFSSEDGLDIPDSNETGPAKDVLREQSSSGADAGTPDSASMHQIDIPVQLDNLTSRNDSTSASLPTTFTSQAEMSKLRSAQQAQQYSYLQSPNYSSLGMVPQIPSSQQGFESSESHLQDMPSAPSSMKQQHYTDPATSYYSPAFRPGSDGDARYPQYLPGSTAAKYNVMPGQHLPSTQEVGNSAALSSATASQAPQTGHTHSMPTAPQQPLPVHAYPAQPAGVPLGHFANVFGYQYPSYTFVPTPYQHSYTTSYPQPPVSSYPPSANYAPGGVAAVKYTLPQYKPGNATANAPLSAATAGYGGYGTASSMYAGNPAATATNTSGYEDASGGQYKDSNLYIHGPQGDGARLWIQSQLSGDVAAAQTSSFYALSGQNQHTSYTQPNSHTHPMAGYTSLYHHPSQQPGPAASAHQLIQQPQTLSGAAGSTQVGATYQQLQRMQPNWNAY